MKTLEERRLELEKLVMVDGVYTFCSKPRLWQWFKLQLEERDNERLKEVSGKVNNIWEIAYKEKASKDHKDRYLNGVVRGITLVGRYLSTLKNSKEKNGK